MKRQPPSSRETTGPSGPLRRPTQASRADRHDLYQRAVQCVEAEIDFVDETFQALRNRKPVLLREDFCGTGNTACEWVRRRPTNCAVGLDIDPAPLAWGAEHNLAKLTPSQRRRLRLERGDVLAPPPDLHRWGGRVDGPDLAGLGGAAGPANPGDAPTGFDVILAMNFSFWTFQDRATMLRYFRAALASLASDGIMFLDFYGGPDALKVMKERRPIGRKNARNRFTYIWDQSSLNPITGEMHCKIHFAFPDGSRMRDAFTYTWRLWTLPEIRDIIREAGFSRSTVYWEGDDGEGGGDGYFTASEVGDNSSSWVAYVTAER